MTKFEKFEKFVNWYNSLGGKILTAEEIEKCYLKF